MNAQGGGGRGVAVGDPANGRTPAPPSRPSRRTHHALCRFASKYRLKVRRDEDGRDVIRGRTVKSRPGERKIADHGADGLLSVSVSNPGGIEHRLSPLGWAWVKKRCLEEAGMRLAQDGDSEGVILFDPANPKQAEAAIEECGCFPKRELPPEELEMRRELARQNLVGVD